MLNIETNSSYNGKKSGTTFMRPIRMEHINYEINKEVTQENV